MSKMELKFVMVLLLCIPASCNSERPGCTDPDAINYDSMATRDDNSCIYDTVYLNPEWSLEISEQLDETSGLIYWDDLLWTINDNTDTLLYGLDPVTGVITAEYVLPGVVNRDWEEISQDDQFIYVGDFGNNMGDRTDLHILRVEKSSLGSPPPNIDTIWFSYSDQEEFTSPGLNQTEFDCEAFVVTASNIYLFTKQWISGNTTLYVMPKLPGNHVAQKRAVYQVQGLITGATLLEQERLLVLCGYTGLLQPFLSLFYHYEGDDFFSGTRKRVNISLPFHQVEGIATADGTRFYLTNEYTRVQSYINIPQKLHRIDLSGLLGK